MVKWAAKYLSFNNQIKENENFISEFISWMKNMKDFEEFQNTILNIEIWNLFDIFPRIEMAPWNTHFTEIPWLHQISADVQLISHFNLLNDSTHNLGSERECG